jgi:Glycosyl transferases group 1
MTDLLLVSLGTTRGLRVADAAFLEQARAAGASVEAVGVRIGLLDRLRRAYPVNDLVEAGAASRATAVGIRRTRPRAVVFSTVTASMMAPRLDVPYAVRLDSPSALNRPGARNAALHALERRSLAGARLVLPWSRAAQAALPDVGRPSVVLPPPVVASGEPAWKRDRVAVGYAPDPKAKGLEVLCRAWERAAVRGARLDVYGIEPERARRHLARTETPEPRGVCWRGMTAAGEFRSALRRSLVYVAAARWEDFGQAPLEALADGALLVTVPSGGAYEALALARELAPELAAAAIDADALATSLRAAFAFEADAAHAYRERAAGMLAAYRPEALEATIRERVLPALLR